MLNVDRVWSRVKNLPEIKSRGPELSDWMTQAIGQQFTLTTGQTSAVTRVDFPSGAIILNVDIAGEVQSQAGTDTSTRSRRLVRIAMDFPNSQSIITGGRMNAAAVFGPDGAESCFPPKEIIIGNNGSLNYTVENLTTSTILVDIVHLCLTPRKAAA